MIALVVAHVVGLVVGTVVWRAMRPVFVHELFRRQNYRGHELVTSTGLVIAVAVLPAVGVARLVLALQEETWPTAWSWAAGPVVTLTMGFALLGLLDDLVGVGESGGFRGHLAALARGRLTTGGIKLLGGAALSLCVIDAVGVGTGGAVATLRDGAVISLAANLANLFDRAPGRVLKVGQAAFLVLVVFAAVLGRSSGLAPVAFVAGAALALLPSDLREESMVGDAGSNVIGAVLGLGAVTLAGPGLRWIVLAVLLGLNLLSEVVSFTKVIDATPPLRWLDRLGSPHRER